MSSTVCVWVGELQRGMTSTWSSFKTSTSAVAASLLDMKLSDAGGASAAARHAHEDDDSASDSGSDAGVDSRTPTHHLPPGKTTSAEAAEAAGSVGVKGMAGRLGASFKETANLGVKASTR